MKRLPLLAPAALLVALGAALAVLPARWLIGLVPDDWPMAIVDASGSVWRGQALVAVGPAGMRRTLPDPFAWRWQWRSGTGPVAAVEHPWLQGPLALAPRWNGVRVGAQTLRLPATALAAAGAPLNTLAPRGSLELSWPSRDIGGTMAAGSLLQLTWRDAGSALSRVQPLGSYQAALSVDDKSAVALQLRTLAGPLRIEGSGGYAQGRLRFAGQAQAAPGSDAATRDALDPLLRMLGPRRDGVTRLQFP